MIQQIVIVVELTNNDSLKEFSRRLDEAVRELGKNGYKPSEIEHHYQQSDRRISCLIIGKRDI